MFYFSHQALFAFDLAGSKCILSHDEHATENCDTCHTCMDVCPTNVITSPFELFAWSKEEFLELTQGNPIRRIGHERWHNINFENN